MGSTSAFAVIFHRLTFSLPSNHCSSIFRHLLLAHTVSLLVHNEEQQNKTSDKKAEVNPDGGHEKVFCLG